MIARAAAMIVSEGYGEKTRVEETIEFAKRCNYHSIGLAFCIGLSQEAKIFEKILTYHGLHTETLFIKYSEAPVTVLAVKDRVLAHNPLGTLYMADSYYNEKLFPPKKE